MSLVLRIRATAVVAQPDIISGLAKIKCETIFIVCAECAGALK
jgi:hypothetical protein